MQQFDETVLLDGIKSKDSGIIETEAFQLDVQAERRTGWVWRECKVKRWAHRVTEVSNERTVGGDIGSKLA